MAKVEQKRCSRKLTGHQGIKKGLAGEHGFLTLPLFLSPVKGTILMFADQEADVTNVLVASFWRRALDAIKPGLPCSPTHHPLHSALKHFALHSSLLE